MLFLMWWRNIYSRINSHGFCEMKSATKYWQVFSAISSDPVRSERKGAWAFLSHGSSGLPHSFRQSWFHHRGALPAPARVQDALLRCSVTQDVTCWFSICHRSCRLVGSQPFPQLLSVCPSAEGPTPQVLVAASLTSLKWNWVEKKSIECVNLSFWLSVSKSVYLCYPVYFIRALCDK